MRAVSAQQGRNKTLFKAGKVSIIAVTLPAFCILCWIYWDFSTLFDRFYAIGVEICERRLQESLPFSGIFAVWVEICDRWLLESLPFSADFRYLGRDLRTGKLGISTLSPIFAVWVEISERRYLDSLPFSPILRYLGRDFRTAVLGISTLFDGFPLFG